MSKNEDKIRLEHMLESAREAVVFLGSKDMQDLLSDRMALQAIVRSVEIIGEAANQISRLFKENHAEIPWVQIIGMRNRLIHAYFDIDYRFVYNTVRDDLPSLIKQISQLIQGLQD